MQDTISYKGVQTPPQIFDASKGAKVLSTLRIKETTPDLKMFLII